MLYGFIMPFMIFRRQWVRNEMHLLILRNNYYTVVARPLKSLALSSYAEVLGWTGCLGAQVLITVVSMRPVWDCVCSGIWLENSHFKNYHAKLKKKKGGGRAIEIKYWGHCLTKGTWDELRWATIIAFHPKDVCFRIYWTCLGKLLGVAALYWGYSVLVFT